MKLLHLSTTLFLLSHSLSAMHLSTASKIFARKKFVTHLQKRAFSDCICIKNCKESCLDKKMRCPHTITRNAKMLGSSWELINTHKKRLQQEGLWPEKEGLALENELRSGRYCPNFSYCVHKLDIKTMRISAVGIVSAGLFSIEFPFLIMGYDEVLGNASIGLVGLIYFFYRWGQVETKQKDLTRIAQYNLHFLEPVHNNFMREYEKLSIAKKDKERLDQECEIS